MNRSGLAWLMGLCVTAAVVGPAAGLEIQVAGMGATNVVSDQVIVTVTWPTSEDSYVVLRVDDKFVEGQAPPCSFQWNTNDVPDGPHELKAVEVSGAGQPIGEATIRVRVANSATVPTPVKLAYRFTEGQATQYRLSGRSTVMDVRKKSQYLVPEALYRTLAGRLSGEVTERVAAVTAEGGTLERELSAGLMDYLDRYVRLSGVGQTTSLQVSLAGAVKDGPGRVFADAKFMLPYIPLPENPVNVNDQWQGPLTVVDVLADGSSKEVAGKHRLVGFTAETGEPCALVESEYRYEGPMTITVDLGQRKLDDVVTTGKRLTFLGTRSGQIVRVEETIAHEFTIQSVAYGINPGDTIPGVAGAPPEIIPEEIDLRYQIELVLEVVK